MASKKITPAAPLTPEQQSKMLEIAVTDAVGHAMENIVGALPNAVSVGLVVNYMTPAGTEVKSFHALAQQGAHDEKKAMLALVQKWMELSAELAKAGSLPKSVVPVVETALATIRAAFESPAATPVDETEEA
jgi:hypothetical protein